jgi:hypothetical protein
MELLDFGADFSHNPGDFVAQHGWHGNDVVCGEQHVGVTQPGGLHIDQNFAPYWRGNVHVVGLEPAAKCVNDKCLHEATFYL